MKKLLIANRGEIAIRIARTAAEMGIETLAIYSEDDAQSLHVKKTDEARKLTGKGPAPYLDIEQIIAIAKDAGADAIHPGYGFLAENAEFAKACATAKIVFVGPTPEALALFGDKGRARELAEFVKVPVMPGTHGGIALAEARKFFEKTGAIMLKAVAGGGGRGMRPVMDAKDLDSAFERCASEANAAFGDGALYAEEFFPRARHVEVQIVGDGKSASHIWDRECSLQRARQKIVEIAPATEIPHAVRAKLFEAAAALAEAAEYKSLGTIEFLVDGERYAFIEANARLQVEHTVTEEVTGLDLVRIQLEIADGKSLKDLHLTQEAIPRPRGVAIQTRINMETMTADGGVKPSGGTLTSYDPPSGRGVRVDGFGYAGYQTNARFDSLLAKLVVHAGNLADAKSKTYRALCEFRIGGVPTNIPFLQNILLHPELDKSAHTRFIEDNVATLLTQRDEDHQKLFFEPPKAARRAGAKVDSSDPLAVLHHGKEEHAAAETSDVETPEGTSALLAPLQGTIVSLTVSPGAKVRVGDQVMIMEAMKMEHVITAHVSGTLQGFAVEAGDTVFEDAPLAFIEEGEVAGSTAKKEEAIDLDDIRPDLAELYKRRDYLKDENRPEAVARRRKTGQRTVRENVEDLCDPDSFVEYSSLVVA
ncbi:MAG: carbamoyl-phosphate synthase large subunit, partial [Proteobacteria bacterium]|nr:carbamoyl-phosphate synthase large subunit [Pseudomonadota bacterium]